VLQHHRACVLASCAQMEEAYRVANEAAMASGKSRGHFMVDLCRWAEKGK